MNKPYEYVVDYLEEIVVALSKFKKRVDLDPDRALLVTRFSLGEGISRFYSSLQLRRNIEAKGKVSEIAAQVSDEDMQMLTKNLRFFFESISQVMHTFPEGKRDEGLKKIFSFLSFIMDLGLLHRELYDQFRISASFRSFLSKIDDDAGDAMSGYGPENISDLTKRLFSLSDADENKMKEVILLLSCSIRHLNALLKDKKLTDPILEDSSGFFMALTQPGRAESLTSFLDMSFKLVEEKSGLTRLIRMEFKAWINKKFNFDASGLIPVFDEDDQKHLVQAYRYLFESIFIHSDIRSVTYVLPQKVNPGGVLPEMIQKVMDHLMKADPTYLNALLKKPKDGLRGPEAPVSEAHKLASLILANADKTDDFSFASMMKHWDELLDADMKLAAEKRLYSSLQKFAKEGETIDGVHQKMAEQLHTHMTGPTDVVGNGVLLVAADLGVD